VPATNRLFTLMHDPQYRLAIAWQNVGYNQPPHPSFFLGEGMAEPPKPNVEHADTSPPAFALLTASTTPLWPPNLVLISVKAQLVDLLDHSPRARIVSVSGDRRDWILAGPLNILLLAERGRVYTITVEGKDDAGNVESKTVTVRPRR
jgi:hypothetical protein